MDLSEINRRVLKFVENEINDDLMSRPHDVQTCVARAINAACDRGGEQELSMTEKLSIIEQLPEAKSMKIGFDLEQGQSIDEVVHRIFQEAIFEHLSDVHIELVSQSISDNLFDYVDQVLTIAEYPDRSSHINQEDLRAVKEAREIIQTGVPSVDDLRQVFDAGFLLRPLIMRSSSHDLHAMHGSTYEELVEAAEQMRQILAMSIYKDVEDVTLQRLREKHNPDTLPMMGILQPT